MSTFDDVRDEVRELASHILWPRFDSTPARLEALARRIHDATCDDCVLCAGCGRNMDEGEPHTAECPSALAQDAAEGGAS